MEPLSRRDFFVSAVAVGGASAVTACLDRTEDTVPRGTESPEDLPRRQHAWDDHAATDSHGNVELPRHHVLLHLDLREDAGEDAPRDVEDSFRTLERAYDWSHEGLLFTVGYSHSYFDSVDAESPVPEPEPLADFESPDLDGYDAVVHLASDHPAAVVEAEEALKGGVDEANGVEVEDTLEDVFRFPERRTGFVGAGLPADHQDVDGVPDSEPVPEDSPLYMGFKSGFRENQAGEDKVTIDEGRFEGGTTQQISSMSIDLVQWYEQDTRWQREAKMFCPAHADEDRVEGVGDNLGTEPMTDDCKGEEAVREHAREYGTVGHSEKMTRVRDEDDDPLMIRRDFNSTDGGRAGLHFLAVQESIDDFVETREAMNAADIAGDTAVGARTNNGILQYLDVRSRANYVLPPREKRALPDWR